MCVFNPSEAATNPFNFCIRLIKISILYLFPVVSTGFLCLFLMTSGQFLRKNSALTACFRVRQPPYSPFGLSCPPTATTFAVWILKYATRRLILQSPPISHFRWLLWDFFSLFQSCEIPITLSINSLRKSKVFLHFQTVPTLFENF